MKSFLTRILGPIFVIVVIVSSCANVQKTASSNQVIATVGEEKITFDDLEKAFQKNMNRKNVKLSSVTGDSVKDFLNLYIKYRLKVKDALSRGFDNDSSVIADIKQNRKILSESFYYDKMIIEPHVAELVENRKFEKKIAIILTTFDQGPNTPTGTALDTTKAYEKAMAALNNIKAGIGFAAAAIEYSDDKESAERGGLITRYLTSGNVQRPIEYAIYATKKDEVYPQLIKTRFGYFIIKVIDEGKRQYVKCSHILLIKSTDMDSLAIEKKTDSLLALLKSGADFNRLAEQNSDDPPTAMHGGSLQDYYSRATGFESNGKIIYPEFENALFALRDGQISGIVRTEAGLHIIRRDSTKNPDFEKEGEELKKIYKRLYFQEDKQAFIDSLRDSHGFKIYNQALASLLVSVDTTKSNLDSVWFTTIPQSTEKLTLYTVLNKKTSIGEMVEAMKSRPELRGTPLTDAGMRRAIIKEVEPVVFEAATKNLENQYPEFHRLIRDFEDGILLFRVQAQEVWDKLKFDSVLARSYWDSTRARYMTDTTYNLSEIHVLSDSLSKELYNKIKSGESFENLAEKHTQRNGFREKKGAWGEVTAKTNGLAKIIRDRKIAAGTLVEPFDYEQGYSVVYVKSIEPQHLKTFEEAISDFAPAFQDMMQEKLTEAWLALIKQKFPVTIDVEALDELIAKRK